MPDKIEKTTEAGEVEKGLADLAQWSAGTTQPLSVAGSRDQYKALSPKQCYELSIPVRAAVQAIANNLSKGRLRIFDQSGDEIVDGPLYALFRRPSPSVSQQDFIRDLTTWSAIAGEMAINMMPGGRGTPIQSMRVYDPFNLHFQTPLNPRFIEDVEVWQYYHTSGAYNGIELIPARFVAFGKGFNPYTPVRGLPPLYTGANEATAAHGAVSYNAQFFKNGAIPSHLLVLPTGTTKANREAFTQQYLDQFGVANNNGHKVMVVTGDDIDVKQVEREPKEGEFLKLMTWLSGQIGALYKVPAVEMGLFDKTRFDSADVEREMFMENTLLPMAEQISGLLQLNVVERFYADGGRNAERQDAKLGSRSSTRKTFENLQRIRPDARLFAILDTDMMPIAARIKMSRTQLAGELCEKLYLSPEAAAAYVDIDLPDDEGSAVRKKIFVTGQRICIDDPTYLQPAPATPGDSKGPSSADPSAKPPPRDDHKIKDLSELKPLEKSIREYRALALASLAEGRVPRLKDIDGVLTNPAARRQARLDYLAFRKNPTVADAKAHLNATYTRPFIKSLL